MLGDELFVLCLASVQSGRHRIARGIGVLQAGVQLVELPLLLLGERLLKLCLLATIAVRLTASRSLS